MPFFNFFSKPHSLLLFTLQNESGSMGGVGLHGVGSSADCDEFIIALLEKLFHALEVSESYDFHC